MMRLHPRDLRAIKTGFGTLIEGVGGMDAAAAALGYSKGHLSQAASLHEPRHGPRADHAAELEAILGRPLVTATLARLAGCALLPLPREGGCAGRALAEVLRNAGELGGRVALALADGRVTPEERAELLAWLDALARAVAHAQAVLAEQPMPMQRAG